MHEETPDDEILSCLIQIIKRPDDLDFATFRRYGNFARILIELRMYYSGPNGYEAKPDFYRSAFEFRDAVFGGRGASQNAMYMAQEAVTHSEVEYFYALGTRNSARFSGWLDYIGIESGSALRSDIILAQSLFAITALWHFESNEPLVVREGPYELISRSTVNERTWIFPFCEA